MDTKSATLFLLIYLRMSWVVWVIFLLISLDIIFRILSKMLADIQLGIRVISSHSLICDMNPCIQSAILFFWWTEKRNQDFVLRFCFYFTMKTKFKRLTVVSMFNFEFLIPFFAFHFHKKWKKKYSSFFVFHFHEEIELLKKININFIFIFTKMVYTLFKSKFVWSPL